MFYVTQQNATDGRVGFWMPLPVAVDRSDERGLARHTVAFAEEIPSLAHLKVVEPAVEAAADQTVLWPVRLEDEGVALAQRLEVRDSRGKPEVRLRQVGPCAKVRRPRVVGDPDHGPHIRTLVEVVAVTASIGTN